MKIFKQSTFIKVNIIKNNKNVYTNNRTLKSSWIYVEVYKMEESQKIKCTVESCKYNNGAKNMCGLKAVTIKPTKNNVSGDTDESLCSNYKCCL